MGFILILLSYGDSPFMEFNNLICTLHKPRMGAINEQISREVNKYLTTS